MIHCFNLDGKIRGQSVPIVHLTADSDTYFVLENGYLMAIYIAKQSSYPRLLERVADYYMRNENVREPGENPADYLNRIGVEVVGSWGGAYPKLSW